MIKKYFSIPVFVISICFIVFLQSCKNNEGILPTIGTITESVYASGFVKAKEQYNVVSSLPGIISKIYVEAGDSIRKGDPVFNIKTMFPNIQ